MDLETLINVVGLAGLAVTAAGLAGIAFSVRWMNHFYARLAVVVAGAAAFAGVLALSRREFHVMSYFYLIFLGMLLFVHLVLLFIVTVRLVVPSEEEKRVVDMPPLLKKARAAERSLDFAEATRAYEEYFERFEDPRARGRFAELLIKAGNSRRAVSVLTVAFGEAEEPKLKIALGLRLAEVLLAAERDPVAARTQLEQLRTMFEGGEHEAYVEDLAARMMKRVAEGRYLKKKPERPKYGPG
jgi:hypothetical protein